jgi:two-component system sensor histidine kinase KdpD
MRFPVKDTKVQSQEKKDTQKEKAPDHHKFEILRIKSKHWQPSPYKKSLNKNVPWINPYIIFIFFWVTLPKKGLDFLRTRNYSKKKQYTISLLLIVATSVICFFLVNFIGYGAVALILLMAVSLNAILFDIFPVMVSALLSALIWNFFFIPPTMTFHIETPEDGLMFLMYFVIASINAVLTFKIREFEKKQRDEEERAKSIVLYNTLLNSLSHELKTPIATIIGAVDTIKDKNSKLSDGNKNELYSEIEIAGLRLNRQVENLLSMSRLEAGFIQPKKDWCDINEIIFSMIRRNQEDASNHKVVFEAKEHLPLFRLDGGLLEQALYNIMHNAIQHTPTNSIITIDADQIDDGCVIWVSDNGKGFPENEIESVFRKFYRIHNTTGGTGLGLSIVKGFTEAMNGKVTLENREGGGSLFTITIPAETLPINNDENG